MLGGSVINGVGLGLRSELVKQLLEIDVNVCDFLELAPENWIGLGGKYKKQLDTLAERYPIIAHGLSLSLGGSDAIDIEFISQLKSFFERYNISVYSEHLSYTTDNKGQLYDLLPMPFTVEAINQVVQNIQQVQECLNFKIAIENVSYYCLPAQEMSELEFLLAIIQKADCYLLLDINNIYVNSINHGYDPYRFIDAIPTERILYMHVAGHYTESDELLIDTHGQDVCSQVWCLLEYAYKKHGIWPTLLERDSHIPPLTSLCDELNQIREIQQAVGAVNCE